MVKPNTTKPRPHPLKKKNLTKPLKRGCLCLRHMPPPTFHLSLLTLTLPPHPTLLLTPTPPFLPIPTPPPPPPLAFISIITPLTPLTRPILLLPPKQFALTKTPPKGQIQNHYPNAQSRPT